MSERSIGIVDGQFVVWNSGALSFGVVDGLGIHLNGVVEAIIFEFKIALFLVLLTLSEIIYHRLIIILFNST